MNRSAKPKFKVGGKVATDFNGKIQLVKIIAVSTCRPSQSGIMYKVSPKITTGDQWLDEGWFTEIEE